MIPQAALFFCGPDYADFALVSVDRCLDEAARIREAMTDISVMTLAVLDDARAGAAVHRWWWSREKASP